MDQDIIYNFLDAWDADEDSVNLSWKTSPATAIYCCMALLQFFGSRHNLSEPSGFFTGTMELIHSVYSFIAAMTPMFCTLLTIALCAGSRLAITCHSGC